MIDVSMTIQGLQEAQDVNLRAIRALEPENAAGEAVRYITLGAHRYMVGITHVDTGAYRASHRVQINGVRGEISVDPGATNPRSGIPVRDYAPDEEARGGDHAAYARTAAEIGQALLEQGEHIIMRAIGW